LRIISIFLVTTSFAIIYFDLLLIPNLILIIRNTFLLIVFCLSMKYEFYREFYIAFPM
ncbi:hypothetical protein T4A_11211, partial [Trichinella pseudospiralis]